MPINFKDAKELMNTLRDKFFARLKTKTGWGREELKMEFERAISETFISSWDKKKETE